MSTNDNITGKELLLRTIMHERMDSVPWVPFAGVHAGKLKGYNAIEVLQDEEKLFQSLMEVNEVYDPDGQPIVFDLQIEAEILGCELMWQPNTPPSVSTHPLSGVAEVPTKLPKATDGRLPIILNVMHRFKEAVGDHTALYGLTCGPFTLASHLRGTDIFMDMFENKEYVHELIEYTKKINIRMADMYIDAGMDIIAVVDPLVSQISPKHFRKFLLEPFKEIFDHVRARGVVSSFFVCGDATKSIEVMCETSPDNISIDENVDIVKAKEITDRNNISIGGNIPLTTRMLLGTQQDNMKFTVELMDKLDHYNWVISPGCDMPYDIPIENTIGVLQAIRQPEQTRKMIENYHEAEYDLDAVIIPDYPNLKKPFVEVFTLDSETCAACTYMWNTAKRVVGEMDGAADIIEYPFNKKENVARVLKMGIKNLPSIVINGELKYSSIIPSPEELRKEIEKYIQ
ncbi:MAG: uroporphyrinogen decarboxylase [Chloroflexi bacterium]|nr:uroporphyrinogen decarboxylase [Chloroflexota bacterium]